MLKKILKKLRLTNPQKEKQAQREQHMRFDFPYAYGISLGEWPCNHSCRMCPMYTNKPSVSRFMTEDVFIRACEQVAERKDVSLEISSYGEPFQHPNIDEWLPLSRRICPNAEIVVATNGSLLDTDRCKKIVDSGISHLSFSLDAGSPESHEWLTGTKNYNKICSNLEKLVEIRNTQNAKHLKITCHIIGIKELAHEFDAFLQRWKGVVDEAVVRPYGNWAGLVDANGVTPVEKQNIPDDRYPCTWLWYATKIEPNGDVSKCFIHVTGEKNPLGNIMKEDFSAIWKGEKLAELRKMHCENRYREIEYCPDCIVWSLFPAFWGKSEGGNWK